MYLYHYSNMRRRRKIEKLERRRNMWIINCTTSCLRWKRLEQIRRERGSEESCIIDRAKWVRERARQPLESNNVSLRLSPTKREKTCHNGWRPPLSCWWWTIMFLENWHLVFTQTRSNPSQNILKYSRCYFLHFHDNLKFKIGLSYLIMLFFSH